MRVVLIVILLTLAGCSGKGDVTEPVQDTAATMAIQGVVVDNAIVPLGNATVDVVGANFTLVTQADGKFRVPVAEPGSFELRVTRAGFFETNQVVTVAEGEVADVQILLEAVPTLEPYSEVKKWDGMIQCSLRTPQNAFAPCGAIEALGDDSEERYEEIDTPPTMVQSELVWTSQQPLAESMRLMYTDDHREGTDNYVAAQGTSPVTIRAHADVLQFKHLDSQGLFIRVFTGDFQGTGASLTLQQGFTVITSIYQNYSPPEDWRYTDDNSIYPPP